MNKYILCAVDKSSTEEELKKNAADATYDAADAYDADAAAYAAVYAAAYAAYAAYGDNMEYWLGRYFDITGENIEYYLKAIKELEK